MLFGLWFWLGCFGLFFFPLHINNVSVKIQDYMKMHVMIFFQSAFNNKIQSSFSENTGMQ